jgi:hypothetical protein
MSSNLTAPISTTVTREALAILGATDSLDGRQLIAEAKGDLFPYEVEYQSVVELIELKAEQNHDSRGVRVKLRVLESSAPDRVRVNQQYTLWFFDAHKTLPSQVLAEMQVQRLKFAAALSEYAGDPLEENPDGTPNFKAGPVLLEYHRQVEPLGLQMRINNKYLRSTRNGKRLHVMSFELV